MAPVTPPFHGLRTHRHTGVFPSFRYVKLCHEIVFSKGNCISHRQVPCRTTCLSTITNSAFSCSMCWFQMERELRLGKRRTTFIFFGIFLGFYLVKRMRLHTTNKISLPIMFLWPAQCKRASKEKSRTVIARSLSVWYFTMGADEICNKFENREVTINKLC